MHFPSYLFVKSALRKLSEMAFPRPYISKFSEGVSMPPESLVWSAFGIFRVFTPSKYHPPARSVIIDIVHAQPFLSVLFSVENLKGSQSLNLR